MRQIRFEKLEDRHLLAASTFEPPPLEVTDDNQVQTIRVLVLNYEPRIPTEGNRRLWEVFNWNDPRDLAQGFIGDMERASGGAIDYEIVEWRHLEEFPVFRGGFRHEPSDYVAKRRAGSGLPESDVDFYAIAEEHDLAELINDRAIDEIWGFGDHYFGLFGEAWLVGPQSFFINGPTFDDLPVDRAVAGFGFNYERGVAEMLHNNSHRTENHMSRAFNYDWDFQNPETPWDFFTANVGQTSATEFGVGSGHFPANGVRDYDYSNTQSVMSYADEFVQSYPDQTYDAVQIDRNAWGDRDVGDWHRGYMEWFFGHLPRAAGESPDGRQNNWYKYIYNFNAYEPQSGLPRDNQAILGAAGLQAAGQSTIEFTLRFYDVEGVDVNTLIDNDLRLLGSTFVILPATVVEIGPEEKTTAGTARTVTYEVTGPNGAWTEDDADAYTLAALGIRDVAGNRIDTFPSNLIEVKRIVEGTLDINALSQAGEISVTATPWDIGSPANVFDDDDSSLLRSQSTNPASVTLKFEQPHEFTRFEAAFSHALGASAYRWNIEAADSLDDLDAKTGTYQQLVPNRTTSSDIASVYDLPASATASVVRLTAERLTGDDFVHINDWKLFGIEAELVAIPGDFDRDGDVDAADRTTLVRFWTGALEPREGDRTFEQGDADGDGNVDSADLTILTQNWTGAKEGSPPLIGPPVIGPAVNKLESEKEQGDDFEAIDRFFSESTAIEEPLKKRVHRFRSFYLA